MYVGITARVGKGVKVGFSVDVGKGVYVESGARVGGGVLVGGTGVGKGLTVGGVGSAVGMGVLVGGGSTMTISVGGGVGDAKGGASGLLPIITIPTNAATAPTATSIPINIDAERRPLLPVLGRLSTWRWATSPSLLMKNCS